MSTKPGWVGDTLMFAGRFKDEQSNMNWARTLCGVWLRRDRSYSNSVKKVRHYSAPGNMGTWIKSSLGVGTSKHRRQ